MTSTHPPRPLPIVQSIPHAGLEIPPEVAGRLAVDATTLYNECDLWADQLFDFAHPDLAALHAQMGYAGTLSVTDFEISRALVDANRYPEDLENPDGPVKSQTSNGQEIYTVPQERAEKRALRARYWGDYHRRLDQAVADHAGACRIFLDCHNMAQVGPSAYAFAGAARPKICLSNFGNLDGEARDAHTPLACPPWFIQAAARLAEEIFADLPLLEPQPGVHVPTVAINWPFYGGYIMHRTMTEFSVGQPFGLMVEINRGLFVGNQTPDTPIQPPNLPAIAAIRERLFRWAVMIHESSQIDTNLP